MERILVIKLGALGDFIQALGPMQAIRRHHAGASVVLLTTAPFAPLGAQSGLCDDVWVDRRAPFWNIPATLRQTRQLIAGRFDRVYDLQTSQRTTWYALLWRALNGGRLPEWSGIAPFCSHPHANPRRNSMHTIDRQAEQLRFAGIANAGLPDIAFLSADVARFHLPARYAVLIPGAAGHRPEKRWPAASYSAIARHLVERGVTPVVLGVASERDLGAAITAACPAARNLVGQTVLAEVAAIVRGAAVAIGNDTGTMHVVAASGCPAIVLFSGASDPALCAPRGRSVRVLRRDKLTDLTPNDVIAALPAGLAASLDRTAGLASGGSP